MPILETRYNYLVFLIVLFEGEIKMDKTKLEIIKILLNNQTSMFIMDIAAMLGVQFKEVETIINDMVEELYVKKTPRGKVYMSDYQFGIMRQQKKGDFFLESYNGHDVFIKKEDAKFAKDGDIAVVSVDELDNGKVVRINKECSDSIGIIVVKNNHTFVIDSKNKNIIFRVSNENKFSLVDGHIVNYKTVNKNNSRSTTAQVISIKGHIHEPGEMISYIMESYGIYNEFPPEVIAEMEKMPRSVSEDDLIGRVDFRDDEIITIDGIHTTDFDDAVSCCKLDNGNWLIQTHISDVEHYVKEDSAMAKEALKRGFSSYCSNKSVPMFPRELTNGICSLKEGVDRLTRSYIIELNPNEGIVDYKVVKGIIRSKKRMTYEEAAKVLNGTSTDPDYLKYKSILEDLNKVSKIIRSQRKRRNAIDFDRQESDFIYDENGKVIDVIIKPRLITEDIIEDLMLLTNVVEKRNKEDNNQLCMYRNHGIPNYDKIVKFISLIEKEENIKLRLPVEVNQQVIGEWINQLKDSINFDVYIDMLLRCMEKAKYGLANIGHFALAEEDGTTHATSPIRRAADYSNQVIASKNYSIKDTHALEKMSRHASHISSREKAIKDCERETFKSLCAQYMSNHIGKTFVGKIIRVDNNVIHVDIYNGVIAMCQFDNNSNAFFDQDSNCMYAGNNCYKIGDLLDVKVLTSDIKTGNISLELINKLENNMVKKLN